MTQLLTACGLLGWVWGMLTMLVIEAIWEARHDGD